MQRIAVILLAAGLFGLVSCNKESMIQPEDSISSSQLKTVKPNQALLTDSVQYLLIKHGTHSLEYGADGSLKQVTAGFAKTTYSYDLNGSQITASQYLGGQLKKKITYFMTSGRVRRATKATVQVYDYTNQRVNITKGTYEYQYDNMGRLKTFKDSFAPDYYEENTYDAAGDLIQSMLYKRDANGIFKPYEETRYDYKTPVSPLISDHYPMNPNRDPYLRIFGSLSKHLAQKREITRFFSGSNGITYEHFTYSLNPDGYVTERRIFDSKWGTLLSAASYDYAVTTPGLIK